MCAVQRTLLILLVIVFTTAPTATLDSVLGGGAISDASDPVIQKSAVVSGEVELPCNTLPPLRNDSLLLVVWYKDDNPIYSFDTRVPGPTAHWKDDSISDRVRWLGAPTSALLLRDVRTRDQAIYQCRVDFQVSPTKNYKITLDVVELPNKPRIFDERGNEVVNIAGPYDEGGSFQLVCTVAGGNPTPVIQWLHEDTVLATLGASEVQSNAIDVRSLTLDVRNASREHLSSFYTCTADNTLLSPPQRTTVRVELYLRPSTVEILSREHPLSVGRAAELQCRSTGARPPAVITWWLGKKQINTSTKTRTSEIGNETLSILRFMPLKEHNGQVLICRAHHPKLNHSAIESKLPLNIQYVPVATMQLGAKMNPNDIEEGDDVYFECVVDANPPAYKVVWEHNEILLQYSKSQGVILTGNTNLALRNISRSQAGLYTCTASNVEGDGKSMPLQMQVVYKPLCKRKEMKLIGAALQEASSVTCEVESYPPPEAFEWTLNNSAGSIKIDTERFSIEPQSSRSVLTFTPVSEADYGTLSCRATNLAGQQSSPCVFTLLPATRPDAPTNCTVYNLTHDSLDLICEMGYDGGLQCLYIAEVWANEGLLMNSSNTSPLWNLRKLGAKRQLRLVVYAANARGRSGNSAFTVETATRLEPRTEAHETWQVNWALGGVLGAAITIALILCLAFLTMRIRHRRRDYGVSLPQSKIQKATITNRHSPEINEDRNPDLIPLSKGVAECPPEPPPYAAIEAANMKNSAQIVVTVPQTQTTMTHTCHPISQTEMPGKSIHNGVSRSHREVVTTRTPLLASHQESCV